MYFSLFESKRLVLVPTLVVVAIQLLIIHSVSSINMTNSYLQHKCYVDQGKYKSGSIYEKNLKHMINFFGLKGDFHGGFDFTSFYEDIDYGSLILQCRGDSYGAKCRSCYTVALSKLRRECPKYKGGIILYDQCFLEISGVTKEGMIDYDNHLCMSNSKDVTNGKEISFSRTWLSLLNNLTDIAIGDKKLYGKNAPFYAAGERNTGTDNIYVMMQCTKDLSIKACQECLSFMLIHFQDCFKDKQGGRVFGRSCGFRFEIYPFVITKPSPKYLKA